MKIIQVLPTISYGDAVGNDSLAIYKVISELGYETGIYAENIDTRLKAYGVYNISKLPKLTDNDIIIFNHSTGTRICYDLPNYGGRKMMIYHNITPPEFFEGYSETAKSLCRNGYEGTKFLRDKIDYVMAVSEYNAGALKNMGYNCPMFIRPVLIPFEDYKAEPDSSVVHKYSDDGYVNIIFVGRIAPNKKQEDVIAAFAYYKKHINPKSRLIMIGSGGGMEKYTASLKEYVDVLGLKDVIFTEHISFRAILAYYSIADIFLCMSEHEGFCVPLVESMFFKVPIIAYDSSAIPDTLGGSGVLVKDKDPVVTALLINRIVNDDDLKRSIIKKQSQRLEYFSYENMRSRFIEGLNKFIEKSF